MLCAHEEFAKQNGIKETLIAESGDVVALQDKTHLKKIDRVTTGLNCVDGNEIIDLTGPTIKERATMGNNGHIGVSFVLNSNDQVVNRPEVSVNGIFVPASMKKRLQTLISQTINNEVSMHSDNPEKLKDSLARSIKLLVSKYFGKKPLVSLYIHRC